MITDSSNLKNIPTTNTLHTGSSHFHKWSCLEKENGKILAR